MIEPDIAGNVGTMLRTAACFRAAVHIVEPCGFAYGDRALRRAGMDYATTLKPMRHADRAHFLAAMRAAGQRLLLLETDGDTAVHDHRFAIGDILIVGSEAAGTPADVRAAVDRQLVIPMEAGFRSLNVAVAAGIALAVAHHQLNGSDR